MEVHTCDRGWECTSALGPVALHLQTHFLERAAAEGAGGAAHQEPGHGGLSQAYAAEFEELSNFVQLDKGVGTVQRGLPEEAERPV